ncbi:retropepsin-like aspartic protease [Flavobacterium kingsejongi]|uniref:Acid protease n=1 Tax=Flavobacterium kingsejongi TaxID=1678728 RepID=A0A2S1LMB2_9FLAO|nr:retropepsin-like aspartic protease [Flavobacterium kingsejongi]AWG24897.1 acid protease [Flavobacterium kingsejongi]
MENLPEILKENGYKKIKFKISKTQHLLIKAKINDVEGNFILDTGASNSCVGFESIDYFNLHANDSKTRAAGAGATGMPTKVSENNNLKMGRWEYQQFDLVIFDLSHVNLALKEFKANPVHGIIGADILQEGSAIIDYANSCVYLIKLKKIPVQSVLF